MNMVFNHKYHRKYIVVVALVCTCCTVFSQEPSAFNRVISGSEPFSIEWKEARDYIISNPIYKVILKGKHDCGEKITLIDKSRYDTILSLDWGASYFFGIYDNYMFIDRGTGSLRRLVVYDINRETFIFSTSCECCPQVRNDSIFYQYPFLKKNELPAKLPQCSAEVLELKSFGYSEARIFILPTRELIKTGVVKCEYRE